MDSRRPLFECVLRTTLKSFDLDTAEGRVSGLRAAGPIVSQIRDLALRSEYTRRLAGWVGMPEEEVRRAVQNSPRPERGGFGGGRGQFPNSQVSPNLNVYPSTSPAHRSGTPGAGVGAGFPGAASRVNLPNSTDPIAKLERQALECLLQLPASLFGVGVETVSTAAFRVPMFSALFTAIIALGGLDKYAELWRDAEDELGLKGITKGRI